MNSNVLHMKRKGLESVKCSNTKFVIVKMKTTTGGTMTWSKAKCIQKDRRAGEGWRWNEGPRGIGAEGWGKHRLDN